MPRIRSFLGRAVTAKLLRYPGGGNCHASQLYLPYSCKFPATHDYTKNDETNSGFTNTTPVVENSIVRRTTFRFFAFRHYRYLRDRNENSRLSPPGFSETARVKRPKNAGRCSANVFVNRKYGEVPAGVVEFSRLLDCAYTPARRYTGRGKKCIDIVRVGRMDGISSREPTYFRVRTYERNAYRICFLSGRVRKNGIESCTRRQPTIRLRRLCMCTG